MFVLSVVKNLNPKMLHNPFEKLISYECDKYNVYIPHSS